MAVDLKYYVSPGALISDEVLLAELARLAKCHVTVLDTVQMLALAGDFDPFRTVRTFVDPIREQSLLDRVRYHGHFANLYLDTLDRMLKDAKENGYRDGWDTGHAEGNESAFDTLEEERGER